MFSFFSKDEEAYSDSSDDKPLVKMKLKMTTTGKATFYLIVLKVWAMELQDRGRFFFSDNAQSANVSVQKEKCDGRKTTLHVNTAKKKQGTVQVMVNLSITT